MVRPSVLLFPAAALAVALATAAAPVRAEDGPTARPELSISLDDGQDRAQAGERITWTVTLHNHGDRPVTGLRIEQVLPAGARPAGGSSDTVTPTGAAIWRDVTLGPRTARSLQVAADLGATGDTALHSSSVVCAYRGDDAAPLVCADDLDLLPAGERALAAADSPPSLPWLPAVATAVLAAVGAVLIAVRRRDRADPPEPTGT
ncbi:hypothetical protein ACIRPK_16670 [Kitasatospora sp. NPDC101801]|uniref:hypothetical protein n=1 Tax=Kitasatospora sp. NPDC101801 TaxID=3364103 RepID=UPI0037FF2301